MWDTWIRSLGWEDPPEKGKATHSSILPWRIPGTVYIPWGCKESDTTERLSLHFTSETYLNLREVGRIKVHFHGQISKKVKRKASSKNMFSEFMLIYTLYPRQNQKEKLFLLHCRGSGPEHHHTIELGPQRGFSGAADLSLSGEGPALQPGNQHKTSTQPEDGLTHFSHASLLQLLALSAVLEKMRHFC